MTSSRIESSLEAQLGHSGTPSIPPEPTSRLGPIYKTWKKDATFHGKRSEERRVGKEC